MSTPARSKVGHHLKKYGIPIGGVSAVLSAAMAVGGYGVRLSDMRTELDAIESVKPEQLVLEVKNQGQAMAREQAAHDDELRAIHAQLDRMQLDLKHVGEDAAYVRGLLGSRRADGWKYDPASENEY